MSMLVDLKVPKKDINNKFAKKGRHSKNYWIQPL